MEYLLVKERYARYQEGGIAMIKFEADNDFDALEEVLDDAGQLYVDEDEDASYSIDDLKGMINVDDGCDYIFYIYNITNKETLYKDEQFELEYKAKEDK